jgi:putative hemolysin
VGDAVEVNGNRLTVTEMDGRRIARVRVSPLPGAPVAARPTSEDPAT